MDIRIIKSAPAGRTDMTCRFVESGKYLDKGIGTRTRPDERAESLRSGPSGVVLELNISAMRDIETDEARRSAAGISLRYARKWGGPELVWMLDGAVDTERFTQLATGALLADYEYSEYKSKPASGRGARRLSIVAGDNLARFKTVLERLQSVDQGVRLARDLVNRPPNAIYPESLAAAAREMCEQSGLAFKILNQRQLEAGSYAGLLAVGQGSRRPPVMFSMTYKPAQARRDAAPICFVGKGVTFDTGGISIKPWDGMWDMKGDMGGAGAVIGAMRAIAALKPSIPVVGVVASAENMPDGNAYRPGDILTYRNGRTVEIHSTDAEGRLILADALIYAQETLQQHRIVEFSTLTGACVRALGHQYIGLFSVADELRDQVVSAAQASGEAVWALPMNAEYRGMIKSSVADIKNVGGALAGASTAAMFLQEFIEPETSYAHLDIAGVFLADKADKYFSQPGGTGAGVRLAVELVELLGA